MTDSHQIIHLITLGTLFEVQYILCTFFLYAHAHLVHLSPIFNMLISPTWWLQHLLKYTNPFGGDFQRGSSICSSRLNTILLNLYLVYIYIVKCLKMKLKIKLTMPSICHPWTKWHSLSTYGKRGDAGTQGNYSGPSEQFWRQKNYYLLCHHIIWNCLLILAVSVLTFSELYLAVYIGTWSQKHGEKIHLQNRKCKLCNPSSLRLHVEWVPSETWMKGNYQNPLEGESGRCSEHNRGKGLHVNKMAKSSTAPLYNTNLSEIWLSWWVSHTDSNTQPQTTGSLECADAQ